MAQKIITVCKERLLKYPVMILDTHFSLDFNSLYQWHITISVY